MQFLNRVSLGSIASQVKSHIKLLTLTIVVLASLFLTSCGSSVPQAVVKQALLYYMTENPGVRQNLVDQSSLSDQIQLVNFRVEQDKQVSLIGESETLIEAHQLTGTYQLKVTTPSTRTRYKRQPEPFQIVLASGDENSTWYLVVPSQPDRWTTLEFLSQPEST